jgi:hypothetical protein
MVNIYGGSDLSRAARTLHYMMAGIVLGCGGSSEQDGQVHTPPVEAGAQDASNALPDATIAPPDASVPPSDASQAPPPEGGLLSDAAPLDAQSYFLPGGVEWAEPGWRSSTGIFATDRCANASVESHAVWSDASGVFLLVSTSVNQLANQSGVQGSLLVHNDGTGWQPLYTDTHPVGGWVFDRGLTGRLGGALLLYPGDCPLRLVTADSSTCAPLSAPDGSESLLRPQDVFVVNDALAYVLDHPRVWRSNGVEWTVLADIAGASSLTAIWADESTVVVAGTRQDIYVYKASDPRFVRQAGVPAGDYYALWGFGPNDLWAGNNGGQLVHFDGVSWQVVRRDAACFGEAVHGLWGADGVLFILTPNELARWDGNGFATLASASCDSRSFRDIWGNSPTEVFVSLSTPMCSVAWFDGHTMRQF